MKTLQLETHAESLLQLSHEYQITIVKVLIENYLIAKESSVEYTFLSFIGDEIDKQISHVTSLLNLSDLYGLKTLKEKCLEILSTNFKKKQLESNTLFMELDLNNRVEIYRQQIDLLEKR